MQRGNRTKRTPWFVDVVLFFEHGQVLRPIFVELDGSSHSEGEPAKIAHKRVKREHKIAACMHWCNISRQQFIEWMHHKKQDVMIAQLVVELNAAVQYLV